MSTAEQNYWSQRWENQRTGWDIGYPSGPLKAYIDQLENKALKILIPGAGNAYEAEYLWQQGFKNVFVLDIAQQPLNQLQARVPDFPPEQLLQEDFFTHEGQYDLILEQTFYCSLLPTDLNRSSYARRMHELLRENGKLVGLWFDFPLNDAPDKRPYGGSKELHLRYLAPFFQAIVFERAYNSIQPRQGNELFGIWQKRANPHL
ncbi:MAG: methyltransferase domain-containing protein [Bacteroidota bacterium]